MNVSESAAARERDASGPVQLAGAATVPDPDAPASGQGAAGNTSEHAVPAAPSPPSGGTWVSRGTGNMAFMTVLNVLARIVSLKSLGGRPLLPGTRPSDLLPITKALIALRGSRSLR
jgi:hypothetical protein